MFDDVPEKFLKEYRDAFLLFDKDRDGCITARELAMVMRSLNHESSDADIKEIINEVDINGNGKIDFEEFVMMMNKRSKETDSEEEVINAFRVFDKEGNGNIGTAELKHIMSTLGDKITEEEIDEMLREADVNSDGYINYEEFVRMMMFR